MGHGPNQVVGHPWCCYGALLRTTAAMLRGEDAWRCRAQRLIGPLCVSWHPFSAAAWRGRRRLGRGWGRFVVDRDWPVDAIASQMPCQCNAQCTANSSGLADAPSGHHPLSRFSGSFSGSCRLATCGLLSHLAACYLCTYCRHAPYHGDSFVCSVVLVDSGLVLHLPFPSTAQTTSMLSVFCILHSAPFRCLRRTGTYAVLPKWWTNRSRHVWRCMYVSYCGKSARVVYHGSAAVCVIRISKAAATLSLPLAPAPESADATCRTCCVPLCSASQPAVESSPAPKRGRHPLPPASR